MRIKFLCPHCNHVCRVPYELAGRQGRCPSCNKGVEVPTESTLQSQRESEQGRVDSGRRSARHGHPSDVAKTGDETPVAEGSPATDAKPKETPTRRCPHCAKDITYTVAECEHCGGNVALQGVPWQVIAALILWLCAPLPGLVFAQFGLRAARLRQQHVNLAWLAVGLNLSWLVINVLYMLGKALNR